VGTKVNILNDAADYIEKLENILKAIEKEKQQVMEENHQLLLQLNRVKGWDDCKAPMNDAQFSLVSIPAQSNQQNGILPPNLPQHLMVAGQPIQAYQQQLQAQQFQQLQAFHAQQLLFPGIPWTIPMQPQQMPRTPGPNSHPNSIQSSPILPPNQSPMSNQMGTPIQLNQMMNQISNVSPLNHTPNNSRPPGLQLSSINLMGNPQSSPQSMPSPQQSLLSMMVPSSSPKILTQNDVQQQLNLLQQPCGSLPCMPPPQLTSSPQKAEGIEISSLNLNLPGETAH